jgi:hypothetical protein
MQEGREGVWDEDDIDYAARYLRQTGKMPPKVGTKAYKTVARIWRKATEIGKTEGVFAAAEQGVRAAKEKADQASLTQMQKQYDSLEPFVKNMDMQVARVKEFIDQAVRVDPRIMNIPIRLWKQKIGGSAIENIIELYNTEISTEMVKVAGAATQSIREPSVETRERWEGIHDLSLNGEEMMKVLNETTHAAHMRFDTIKNQRDTILDRIRTRDPVTTGGAPPPTNTPGDYRSLWE